MHPPPGAQDRPSFAALVANVDSDTSKYIADLRVQTGRREMIHDLESMAQVSTGAAIVQAKSDRIAISECWRCT